jgi:N6-L-threonylcarbamoyladenine synthase
VGLQDIEAIAVAHRPGLIGSLLIGLTAAKTLAWSLGKPLVGVDHVQAHLYSVMLEAPDRAVTFPAVGLVCSGGHTAIYLLKSWTEISLLGKTIDDAVGEAYDKVSAMLGLGYPGGPVIDKLALQGDPRAIDFPRSMLSRESLDFSFSGLKTSVKYFLHGQKGKLSEAPPVPNELTIRNVCASFQAACVETLIKKLGRAIAQHGARSVIVGGGVSANRGLREALKSLPVPSFAPAMSYCTDNAAMIAGLGCELLRAGQSSTLDLDAATGSWIR